jgi:hypothetical protein
MANGCERLYDSPPIPGQEVGIEDIDEYVRENLDLLNQAEEDTQTGSTWAVKTAKAPISMAEALKGRTLYVELRLQTLPVLKLVDIVIWKLAQRRADRDSEFDLEGRSLRLVGSRCGLLGWSLVSLSLLTGTRKRLRPVVKRGHSK